jgi:ATP-binding protein involved in chromosome partitioning
MTDTAETARRDAILRALAELRDPATGKDIVSAGLVSGLTARSSRVAFMIEGNAALEPLRQAAEAVVRGVPGVDSVTAILSQERDEAPPPRHGGKGSGLAGVRQIVAVSSAKGGVGKSTIAVNLAVALAQSGLAIGLIDADIYGPSVPRLLGLTGRPDSDGDMIVPMRAHGLKAISIGSMIEGDTAMVWRGPMATSALSQLLTDVAWGALDILVVDMPPGTGDIALTLAQRAKPHGAVIVSTPQDIALIDARKGITMFGKLGVPLLGIVENMSYFLCPSCGTRSEIFGHGGARETAQALAVPFLGEVPLHARVRELSDSGTPIMIADPDCAEARAIADIAGRVRTILLPLSAA